ncbi:MAG: hypothetical protein LBK47_10635 [Prevotellaceae bacterium]|jgi:hypothetical protein|nr:hypothetical protein [Prevotellaceae bacterium]
MWKFLKKKEPVEFEDVREVGKKTKKIKLSITDVFTGNAQLREFLLQHIGYVIFLAALTFLYIHNRYAIESSAKRCQELKKEVKNLKAEATTTGAELMYLSSQTSVKAEVERRHLNLVESITPPVLLKRSKDLE